MVDHSHQGLNIIREQMFDIIKGKNFVFENNTHKTIKNYLYFGLIFFNLLTRWLGGKLESLPSLLRVWLEFTKKKSLLKS